VPITTFISSNEQLNDLRIFIDQATPEPQRGETQRVEATILRPGSLVLEGGEESLRAILLKGVRFSWIDRCADKLASAVRKRFDNQ